MPTINKTSLGLNAWLGTDKPLRSDFVQDNQNLDSLLSSHFNDMQKHLSTADRSQLADGMITGSYTGDGKASKTFSLPFAPRMVMVFRAHAPFMEKAFGGDYYLNNFAVALRDYACAGTRLNSSALTVYQELEEPEPGATANNLNESGGVYAYVLFR